MPPALAASAGLSIAIIEGTRQGMTHASPASAPAPCAPGDICFRTPTVNTTGIDDRRIPECAHEDDRGPCIWHAKKHGNHKGHDFRVDAEGKITRI